MTAGLYPYRPSRIGSGLKNKSLKSLYTVTFYRTHSETGLRKFVGQFVSLKSLYTVTFYRTHTRALNPHELPHEQPQALGLCWSGVKTLRMWICGLPSRYVPCISHVPYMSLVCPMSHICPIYRCMSHIMLREDPEDVDLWIVSR